MGQYPIIIFSSLIFLTSLFIFKAILPALVIALVSILLTVLFGKFWYFKKTPAFLVFIKSLTNLIISIILALSVFTLIYFPLEFLMTEIWFLIPKIPSIINVGFLILLVFVFNLIDWEKLIKIKFSWFLMAEILILVVASTFVYRGFKKEKLAREYLPKIYRVDREWGIQAQIVKIKGVNFFPIWKKGKVVINGEELIIKFWDEKLIVAEQQVPSEFGQMKLNVVRVDGVISNSFPFEIKNPSKLSTF